MLDLSITNAIDIMKIPLNPKSPDFPRLLGTKQAVAASVFATAARIDEAQLRRVQTDKLDELLEAIRRAESEEAISLSPSV